MFKGNNIKVVISTKNIGIYIYILICILKPGVRGSIAVNAIKYVWPKGKNSLNDIKSK